MCPDYDFLFKFRLLGDSGVGKSSLLLTWVDNAFPNSYISTIGVDFKIKLLQVGDKTVKCQVWDVAGQERFRSQISNYYGYDAEIVMFDLTDQVSFNNIKNLVHAYDQSNSKPMILVGAKADLIERRVVSPADIKTLCVENNVPYVEASAKTGLNVECVFEAAVLTIMNIRSISKNASPLVNDYLSTRLEAVEKLKSFIARIESHSDKFRPNCPDFSHGFWFFAKSRALNREANYYLAKAFLSAITQSNESLHDIFDQDNIIQRRNKIIGANNLDKHPDFADRNINDDDLNSIIATVQSILKYDNSTDRKDVLRK